MRGSICGGTSRSTRPRLPTLLCSINCERSTRLISAHVSPFQRGSTRLRPRDCDSAASYAEWLMDRDRKSTPLKTLQGKIWEEGYQRGELVGEVFADVPPALSRWHAQGAPVGIFSSGSVLAQQLLFRHSSAGDLTPFLRWYFDTTTGKKADSDSYRRIAAAMNMPPQAIVFVSDIVAELDAARDAGLQTRLSIRPGNAPPPPAQGHAVIRTFDEFVSRTW